MKNPFSSQDHPFSMQSNPFRQSGNPFSQSNITTTRDPTLWDIWDKTDFAQNGDFTDSLIGV